jgi:hypothetical protein
MNVVGVTAGLDADGSCSTMLRAPSRFSVEAARGSSKGQASLARGDREQELRRDVAELRSPVRRTGRPSPDAAPHTRAQQHGLPSELQDEVRRARRPASSVRISSRALVHGTGDTRPSRTSADRRRSSLAQTATTSSSISSRLDSNSAAIRARSSRDSRSASTSKSSVDIIVSLALWSSGSG